MQIFTGVPAVVDLAAMRDAMKNLGGDPQKINPLVPVDLVIDHSVIVDASATVRPWPRTSNLNTSATVSGTIPEMGQGAFSNFGWSSRYGICHQVNLEFLAQTIWTRTPEGEVSSWPIPIHSSARIHTPRWSMAWPCSDGGGGIEAEAVMLGQQISMLLPQSHRFKLTGRLKEGVTATDLVLTVTQMLRKQGVVGKFVEFSVRGWMT